MDHPPTHRSRQPAPLPPVEGAALSAGPGGIVLHLRARGGDVLRLPVSLDALREIAALTTDALAPSRPTTPMH